MIDPHAIGCGKCGKCCRKIHLPWEIKTKIDLYLLTRGKDSEGIGDLHFIANHWEYIGRSSEIGDGFIVKLPDADFNDYAVYQCSMIGPDNLCRIHNDRPEVCRGYPFYDKTPIQSSPWEYKGCTYEKLSLIIDLYKRLVKIRDSFDVPMDQGEDYESKSLVYRP